MLRNAFVSRITWRGERRLGRGRGEAEATEGRQPWCCPLSCFLFFYICIYRCRSLPDTSIFGWSSLRYIFLVFVSPLWKGGYPRIVRYGFFLFILFPREAAFVRFLFYVVIHADGIVGRVVRQESFRGQLAKERREFFAFTYSSGQSRAAAFRVGRFDVASSGPAYGAVIISCLSFLLHSFPPLVIL